eukprot:7314861-Karenia_brevis.AAC.1
MRKRTRSEERPQGFGLVKGPPGSGLVRRSCHASCLDALIAWSWRPELLLMVQRYIHYPPYIFASWDGGPREIRSPSYPLSTTLVLAHTLATASYSSLACDLGWIFYGVAAFCQCTVKGGYGI